MFASVTSSSVNLFCMKRDLLGLANGTFDLAIIGGGILGAGIARDAVLRGLSVALVEQADFGSGTSSRSTKLIHGGLRYLEHLEFWLVAEACRERSLLLDLAPHLVQPLSFLLPAYRGDPRSLTQLRLGNTIYDWLVPSRHPQLPRHRTLSPAEAVAQEPCLAEKDLRGAVLFYDCQMDDARLCLETILDAARHGAVCANYCRVTGLRREFDRITAAQVTALPHGQSLDLRAKLYINAAGPWVERVARLGPSATWPITLSPTKGVHLLLPRINHQHGIYFQSRQDRRMLFLLPWDEVSLWGTTDTDYTGDPSAAYADDRDVDYLLKQLRLLVPNAVVRQADLITSFAGVRPLLRDPRHPSRRPREERVTWHGENLLSVAGGKYTTFRAIAEKVVTAACRKLRRATPPCRTASLPLVDHRPKPVGEQLSALPAVYASDVAHACQQEMAMTLGDVLRRRTRLALSRHGGPEVATRVSQRMADYLGWTEATREQNLREYLRAWRQDRPWDNEPR